MSEEIAPVIAVILSRIDGLERTITQRFDDQAHRWVTLDDRLTRLEHVVAKQDKQRVQLEERFTADLEARDEEELRGRRWLGYLLPFLVGSTGAVVGAVATHFIG